MAAEINLAHGLVETPLAISHHQAGLPRRAHPVSRDG